MGSYFIYKFIDEPVERLRGRWIKETKKPLAWKYKKSGNTGRKLIHRRLEITGVNLAPMKTPEIISFHPGKQHNLEQAYQIAKSFKNYKHLTSLYFSEKTVKRWEKISPKIGANLKKRSAPLPAGLVDTNPVAGN